MASATAPAAPAAGGASNGAAAGPRFTLTEEEEEIDERETAALRGHAQQGSSSPSQRPQVRVLLGLPPLLPPRAPRGCAGGAAQLLHRPTSDAAGGAHGSVPTAPPSRCTLHPPAASRV